MKRFLAGMLAIALIVTSLYYAPVEEVHAMTQSDWLEQENTYTTKEQNQGLNFNTTQYNYYFAEEKLNQLPATFEATIRITTEPSRAGIILGNSQYESSSSKEQGTFNFGFHVGMIPYLYVADANNKDGILYRFDKFGAILPEGEKDIYGNDDGLNNTKFPESKAVFQTKQWVHLAIVNDAENETMTCYVDGEVYASATSSNGTTFYDAANWVMSKAMALGSDYRSNNTQQFIGDIKNVAIYADARNEDEIASDCAAMKVENADYVPVADENLMACYALNLDTTTGLYPKTLEDLSNNSYDMVTYDWLTSADMEANNLTISRDDYSYSMAVIGDPQMLASDKDRVETLYQWVKDNAEAKNIQFAFQMGDTVDSSTSTSASKNWKSASNAVKMLNGIVPYSIVRGNHDSIEFYNQYYPYSEYKDSLSGSYDENMLNTYQKFQVGDIKYLVLNLDFGVGASSTYYAVNAEDDRIMNDGSGNPDKVLAWANEVVKANPDHNVILTTHGYMNSNEERLQSTSTGAPTSTSATSEGYRRAYSGEDIYEKLVKDNSNVVLVLSGHIETEKIVQRTVEREDGSKVVEMLVNPQSTDRYLDDCGLVAMMYFDEMNTETKKQDVTLQYYATLRDRYYLKGNQNIKITLDVIDSDIFENEDGSVAISYDNVIVGEDAVTAPEAYKDYVFAGWYSNAGCTTAITDKTKVDASSYALFKPSSLLDVKMQITNAIVEGATSENTTKYNGNYVIRFVSSVDCLDYKTVGFVLETEDGTQLKSISKRVFKGIESSNAGSAYNFSPKVISEQSQYLITAKLPVSPENINDEYVVRAYWETMDGTVVYGDSRCVSVKDNNVLKADTEKDTINMVVSGELTGTGYTASFTSSSDNSGTDDDFTVPGAEVEVLNVGDGYSNVRITLPAHGDYTKMASLTKVTIDGTDSYGMFRNYYTSHKSGTASAPHADTSWYYASEDQNKYVIASSADLFGFAALVDSGITFAQKKVVMVADIEVNKGEAIPSEIDADGTIKTEASWKASDGELTYVWNPIGNNSRTDSFAGTFDGDYNTISGLYRNGSTAYSALFTCVSSATIQNVSIMNSYIDSSNTFTATIVAMVAGDCTLKNIYTDAVLVGDGTNSAQIGGLIGRVYTDTISNIILENCWFDGEINSYGGRYIAGMVAQFFKSSNITATNCLMTGNIYNTTNTTKSTATGGILGWDNAKVTAKLTNCVVLGDIHIQQDDNVGNIVGIRYTDTTTITMKDCYAANTIYLKGKQLETATAVYNDADYNTCMKEESWFTSTALADMFEDASAWVKDERATTLNQPILKEFAEWIYVYGDK